MTKWGEVACLAMLISFLATFLLRPNPKHQVTTSREWCARNLKEIGTALRLYADAHGGRYPDSLEELVLSGAAVTKYQFCCPSSNDQIAGGSTPGEIASSFSSVDPRHLSYVYLGRGVTRSGSAAVPLLCDRLENHDRTGVTLLWTNGDVRFVPADEVKALLGDQDLE